MDPTPAISNNPERQRYEIRLGDERVGLLTYRVSDGVMTMLHAEIDPAHGGQGLGTALARGALEDARSRGLSVRPLCPFVANLVRREPAAYADIVVG
ncbi:MAG TPA: GNAT family N-acetyltransferase [Solirubrobacteraceae bacterium]|nr:GNAT family N-acetyltransferase [Solirubrobacteraceae bacterium]